MNQQQSADYLAFARDVFAAEMKALGEVEALLGQEFSAAVNMILQASGRVVLIGMGKSGHIARKIAASMASTGTSAFFVHPAEAAHGDLGMIVDGDVVLALSYSGESDEILALIPSIKRKKVALICMTGNAKSTMARHADVHLPVTVSEEACPLNLAPTSSTTATLVLGDALTVALLRARSFSVSDFALCHPAGSLGRRLLLSVGDIMHMGDELPLVVRETRLQEAIVLMSKKGLGLLLVVDDNARLIGIFTDGDLRRLFEQGGDLSRLNMQDVMKKPAHVIRANVLATEALLQMENGKISALPVVDEGGALIGALTMHDLLKARIV